MRKYATECIKMCAEWTVQMFFARNFQRSGIYLIKKAKIDDFLGKNSIFCSKPSECINMHQNASKCMQNELCKCFVHGIIQNVILITSKGSKIIEIHLPLYGGTPCIIKIFESWQESFNFHIIAHIFVCPSYLFRTLTYLLGSSYTTWLKRE